MQLKVSFDNCIKKLLVFVLTGSVLFLTACGETATTGNEATTENISVKAGTVQLYHITDTDVVPDEERYQLLQPDNPTAALEEIIEKMALIDGLSIDRYLIDGDGNVTLFMTCGKNISEEHILLSKAAIVRSVSGIGVKEIAITIQDEEGSIKETATYTDASFYYYSD